MIEVEEIDVQSGTVKQLEDLPSIVKNGALVLDENDIYIFGGWNAKETVSTVFRFDIKSGSTIFDGFMANQAEGHACVRIPQTNTVFLFGGFDSVGVSKQIIKYDLKTKMSCVLEDVELEVARENHTA